MPAIDTTEAKQLPVMLERAIGRVSLGIASRETRNVVRALEQSGCARLLFPAIAAGNPLEAVIVNTAGGLTGGDRFEVSINVGEGAKAVVTTQACERLYRASGLAPASVSTQLTIGPQARLAWLPQETILFDGSALFRKIEVDCDRSASVTLVEAVILGRRASGETLSRLDFKDRWRIRRGGKLVFAEEMHLGDGLSSALSAKAALGGKLAYATVLHLCAEAPGLLDAARLILGSEDCEIGTGLIGDMLVSRLVATDGAALRRSLLQLVRLTAGQVPLVWSL